MRKFTAFALPLVLVLGLAVPAVAQTMAPRTLTMTGTGSAKAMPDIADISAGVTSDAPTAAAALTANSASMNRIFAALDRAGVARRNVQTRNLTSRPPIPTAPPRTRSSASPAIASTMKCT